MLLPAAFAVACAAALWTARRAADSEVKSQGAEIGNQKPEVRGPDALPQEAAPGVLAVRWRAPLAARPAPPCAFPDGWIVADAAGGVTALSPDGAPLWHTAFSNQVFDAGAAVAAEVAVVASRQGQVAALRTDTGRTVWARETGASFQCAARVGTAGGGPVVWLLSQADGQLVCLSLKDGTPVWKSEPTNRSDGEPLVWRGLVAYGNCDGAVHVFDAETGRLKGSVAVGADDQMAGGVLAAGEGLFVAGTRQGRLAVVDPAALALAAQVGVSESEMFVTPVAAFDGLVATGTLEGDAVFCRFEGKTLRVASRVPLKGRVTELAFAGGRLYALAGGDLCALSGPQGAVSRVALGDDVYGLSAAPEGGVVCVADQAVVCVQQQGGGQ
jgi:outer membrane protein assembly factor BamB